MKGSDKPEELDSDDSLKKTYSLNEEDYNNHSHGYRQVVRVQISKTESKHTMGNRSNQAGIKKHTSAPSDYQTSKLEAGEEEISTINKRTSKEGNLWTPQDGHISRLVWGSEWERVSQ